MADWITVIVGTLTLIAYLVVERRNLISAIDDYKTWKVEKEKKKQAFEVIESMVPAKDDNKKVAPKLSPVAFYAPFFFISIISSAILNGFGDQIDFFILLSLSASIYTSISFLSILIFLVASRRFQWKYFLALVLVVFVFGLVWGAFLAILEMFGLKIIWSGIIAGFLLTVSIWSSSERDNRRAQRIKEG